MTDPMDIDHLRGWIGKEESATETLTPARARQFNATFDSGGDGEKDGDPAPLLIHLCLAQPAAPMAQLGRDGHPALGGFLPPVPLPRRMWAGGAFEFIAPIRIGDTVLRRSTIADVQMKKGRSGMLCFVEVRHDIMVDEKIVITESQTIVYRGADSANKKTATAEPAPAAPKGMHQRKITPHPTLLFRYSSMTFNGHRIHYDRKFAMETEGYPGLVVHGPMQASLLCRFAADIKGIAPKRFSFRSLAAIFDDGDFTLNAAAENNGTMQLWTAAHGGPIAMQAEAIW